MRYKYKQSLFTILLFGAICLVDAATIIKVIVDWVNGKTFNVAVNIITLVLCVLVVVPIVMTLTTRYKISAEHLNMYLGIINLTKNKIQTSNIVYVARRKNQLFVWHCCRFCSLPPAQALQTGSSASCPATMRSGA